MFSININKDLLTRFSNTTFICPLDREVINTSQVIAFYFWFKAPIKLWHYCWRVPRLLEILPVFYIGKNIYLSFLLNKNVSTLSVNYHLIFRINWLGISDKQLLYYRVTMQKGIFFCILTLIYFILHK